jgi:hypothetical protein
MAKIFIIFKIINNNISQHVKNNINNFNTKSKRDNNNQYTLINATVFDLLKKKI